MPKDNPDKTITAMVRIEIQDDPDFVDMPVIELGIDELCHTYAYLVIRGIYEDKLAVLDLMLRKDELIALRQACDTMLALLPLH